MVQQFNNIPQGPQKTRQAVILFLKGSATPVVMYFENPQAVYAELKQLMKSPTPVLVEKEPIGPIKKLCFISTQIAGLVLQEEPYV
jgi:hypothetical protein